MCDSRGSESIEARGFCCLRFFVYREYREIRYLGNPDFARYDKFSERSADLYELTRSSFAPLWHSIASATDLSTITKPFEDKTGLTLTDLEEAFRHGEWSPFGGAQKNYGGSKHADIVLHTIRLRDAISGGRWTDLVPQQINVLRDIEHNRPRPARHDYESLLQDLQSLSLEAPPGDCCLLAESES